MVISSIAIIPSFAFKDGAFNLQEDNIQEKNLHVLPVYPYTGCLPVVRMVVQMKA